MALQPDPDILNLWAWQIQNPINNNIVGDFEVLPNFTYDKLMDYDFVFNNWAILNPHETLKDVNDRCMQSYVNNNFVSLTNSGLFKFKKAISTTQSINDYELLRWFTQANLRRPPLAANIFAMAAVKRLNDAIQFDWPLQLNTDLYQYIRGMIDAAEADKLYNFTVYNKQTDTIINKQWNIKDLLSAVVDENETNLPISCSSENFFELKIARMMRLEVIVPITRTRQETYLQFPNGQRLTPAEESIYYARSQPMFINNNAIQEKMSTVVEVEKVFNEKKFYIMNRNYDNTTKAYFILFRDHNTYRMAYLN
jgi:hypothetical protein